MSGDFMKIDLSCNRCSAAIVVPGNTDDSSKISCKSCGASMGTWGQIKAQCMRLIKSKVIDDVRAVFGRT